MPRNSALVVTYNSENCVEACLRALAASGWEIIIVDNASQDDTTTRVRGAAILARVVCNSENVGFAAAANQGQKLAPSDILVLLNPDTVAQPGSLDKLVSSFDDPAVGAAGGTLLGANALPATGFQLRRFPTLGAMLCEVLLVNRLWPGNPWNRRYRCLDLDESQPQFVDQPAGACLAVRRKAWESIGGFDESFYPVWFEDVDFCRRLINHGWKIAYCPEARFSHAGAHSVSKLAFRDKQAFWYGNMLRYFSKHHGRFKTGVLRVGILAGLALRSFLSLVGLAPKGVSAREALRGYTNAARAMLQRNPPPSSKQTRVGVAAV